MGDSPENGATDAGTAEVEETVGTGSTPEPAAEIADGAVDEWRRKADAAAKEAISERKKRQALEAKVAEYEASQLSERERAEAKALEAEARAKAAEDRARTLAAKVAIAKAASDLRFVDSDVAAALVDSSSWDFEGDVDVQAKDALKAIAEAKPHLVSGGSTPTNANTRSGQTLTAEDLGRMTPEQIADMDPKEVATILRSS